MLFTNFKIRKLFTTFFFLYKFRITPLKLFIIYKHVNHLNFDRIEERSVQRLETYSVFDILITIKIKNNIKNYLYLNKYYNKKII